MSDPLDNLTPARRVWAYADGELDAGRSAETLGRLAADPAAARAVEHEVRLRAAVARLLSDVPPPGDDLVRKVSALAFRMPVAAEGSRPLGVRPAWRRPAVAAAAAVLLAAGLLVGRYVTPVASPVAQNPTPAAAAIPVGFVTDATRIHVRCSRAADHDSHVGWPASYAALENPVRRYAGGERPYPDLSGIGFRFAGCGPCGRPGQQGVHILYRAAAGPDAISLFVERDQGQFAIDPGRPYDCTRPDGVHPVFAWRAEGLVFFLVGNAREPVEQARRALKLPEPV